MARSVLYVAATTVIAAVAHFDLLARLKSRAPGFLLFVGGVAFFCLWGSRVTWSNLVVECRRGGPALFLVFLAPAVGNALHMLGWRLLFPTEVRPRLWHAFRAFVAAQAGNEIGLGVMGEPVKVAVLPRRHREAAVAALVMDNATALVALGAFFASLGALALAWFPRSLLPHRTATMTGVGIAMASSGAAVVLWRTGRLPERLMSLVRHPECARLVGRARRTLSACRRLTIERPAAVGGAVALHYLGKLWMLVEMLLVMRLLGCGSVRSGVLFSLASALGSIAGGPVPGQVGVTESALLSASAVAGVSLSAGFAIALLRRARGLLWILLGAFLSPAGWPETPEQGDLRA